MKKYTYNIIYTAFVLLACLACTQGCKEQYITYHDKEYLMFADTAQTYIVREDLPYYDLPISSTVACNYDRTFAVEILDEGSTAVEGRDFTLASNNFVIPAGKVASSVRVYGNFETLDPANDLQITFRLVMPEEMKMPLYSDETKLYLHKTNKFNRENFTGWAVVTSLFLYQYSVTGQYQRLVYTSADPKDPNGVIVHDFIADGYDITISFDDDTDPANTCINMAPGQIVSNESYVFGTIYGDNHILVDKSTLGPSYFFGHKAIAVLVQRFYVENLGEDVGTVGNFLTEIDWVSDEEAEYLRREEGM